MSDENEDFSINIIVPDVDNIAQNLQKTCLDLLSRNEFVDCTLACLDGQLQAHKIVLSSVSQYLYNLFSVTPWPTPCSHPVIMLRNSNVSDVQSILEFIYTGKLTTSKNRIPALMAVIRELGVVSLEKAINNAVQTCGIEMFRRLSNSNNNNNNNNIKNNEQQIGNMSNTKSTSSTLKLDHQNSKQNSIIKASEHNNNIIVECETSNLVIKSEPTDSTSLEYNYDDDHFDNNNDDNSDNINQASSSKSIATFNAENSSSSTGQLAKFHRPQLSNGNRSHHDDNHDNNSKLNNWIREGNVSHFKTSNNNNNNNNKSNEIHLQVDKGESFVYTNEDLGMISLDNMEEEEDPLLQDHNNELEDVCSVDDDEMNQRSIMNTKSVPKMEQDETELVVRGGEVSANCCPWCMQVFTSVTLLQRHIKNHLGGQKNFACHYCNSTFARSAHLKRHLRVHTGEKPYSCSVCSRAFARQDKLKIHLERHLTNSTKPANNSMTITSYPPPNQNNAGQVPIKILIPTGGGFLQQQQQHQNRIGNNNNNSGPATITPIMAVNSSSSSNNNSFQKKMMEKSGNCLSIS